VRSVRDDSVYINIAEWDDIDALRGATGDPELREIVRLLEPVADDEPHPAVVVLEQAAAPSSG
jgi:hypothetical protein